MRAHHLAMDAPQYRVRTSDSPDRRPRAPALVVVVGSLALATGVVLGAIHTAFTEPIGAISPQIGATAVVDADAANREVAVRFYAALDALLASGDVTMLPALVHPDFVDHTPVDGDAPGWRSLAARTEALRATLPSLRLSAVAMVGDGDRVVVYLAADGDDRGGGVVVEVPRIQGGQVAQLWGLDNAGAYRIRGPAMKGSPGGGK